MRWSTAARRRSRSSRSGSPMSAGASRTTAPIRRSRSTTRRRTPPRTVTASSSRRWPPRCSRRSARRRLAQVRPASEPRAEAAAAAGMTRRRRQAPMPAKASVKFRLRVTRGDDIAVGPGKVDLLEAIAKTGSITAAAKDLGMSYRRAWLLVDTMNRCFKSPVVDAESGGRRGGGTALTPLGAGRRAPLPALGVARREGRRSRSPCACEAACAADGLHGLVARPSQQAPR